MNRRAAYLALALLGGSTSALLFAGCGDDTTTPSVDSGSPDVSTPDATTEAGMDATPDQTTPADATADRTVAETGSEAGDAGTGEGGDASADADAASDGATCTPYDASGLEEASVQAGKLALLTTYPCAGCHQRASQKVDDAGNGFVLSGNNDGLGDSGTIFPPNLTSDPTTGLGCWSDMQVVNAILTGVDNEGKMLCPSMPKWGNALTTADGGPRTGTPMDAGTAQQIVAFLRSLPVVSNPVPDTTCAMPAGDGGADAAMDGGSDASDGETEAEADSGSADTGIAADAADGATD